MCHLLSAVLCQRAGMQLVLQAATPQLLLLQLSAELLHLGHHCIMADIQDPLVLCKSGAEAASWISIAMTVKTMGENGEMTFFHHFMHSSYRTNK